MNESIIIGNQIQLYFSSHASLAAIGRKVTQLKLFEPIARQVQIAQKQVRYRPVEKLLDVFMALLPGAQGMVEINKRLKANVSCITDWLAHPRLRMHVVQVLVGQVGLHVGLHDAAQPAEVGVGVGLVHHFQPSQHQGDPTYEWRYWQ